MRKANKKIILIDGNCGVGKTTLAKYIIKKNSNIKHINLDNFRKIRIKDILDKKLHNDTFDFFIENYYNQNKIRKVIDESKEMIVVLDGCFVKSLNLKSNIFIYLNSSKEGEENNERRMISLNKGVSKKNIILYNNFWNKIWKYYEEKYCPAEKADFIY